MTESAVGRSTDVWLETRSPSPPDPFRRWLEFAAEIGRDDSLAAPDGTSPESTFDPVHGELTARGHAAIERALQCPGRIRESAFHLLAAGAFYTYVCEFAGERPDTEKRLRELRVELGKRLPRHLLEPNPSYVQEEGER